MLSILTWMEIPFFFVIVKVIIANLAAFSSSTHLREVSSPSETMGLLLFALGMMPQTLGWCIWTFYLLRLGEKLRTSPLYRLIFCIHQCSSPLTCFDRLNCPSREDLEIIPWICSCCKVLYCSGAGRTASAVDDNLPINLLSSLAVTSDSFRNSLHWFFIFSTFSCGRLNVIFCDSPNTVRNSKVDVGSNIDFWELIKNFKCWSRNINVSRAISSSSREPAIKSISSRCVMILIQSFRSKGTGTLINLVESLGAKESSTHRHKNSLNIPFHWNLAHFWEFFDNGTTKYTSFKPI